MPVVPQQDWGNYMGPQVAAGMSMPIDLLKEQQPTEVEYSTGEVFNASMQKNNVISSYQAKYANLPSPDTEEEKQAFVSGEFKVFDAIPEEYRDNPVYKRMYAEQGTSQRKVDWVTDNIIRQEKNNEILDSNVVAGMATSLVATLLSPEQWPTFVIPAGLLLKTGSAAAKLSLTKAVAYEATVGGVSATVAEGILHQTQVTRTKNESMYAVGASVLFSGMLTGVIGLSTRETGRVLGNLDKEMVDIDSNPSVTSVGAKETDIPLPDELEAAAIKRVDQQIADGEVDIKNKEVALQAERRILSDTLSQVKNPKTMRVLGYAHPSVRIATSQAASARTLGEQLISDSLTRGRHLYGDSLGDALEITADQMKYEMTGNIDGILKSQYVRYTEEAGKSKTDKLSFNEFSELVGKANREEDVSDIVEVAAAAKELRSKISKPIEKRLVEQDLIDSYYSGFEALKREDLEDLVPEDKLETYFDAGIPVGDINKRLPAEVMDELQRMGTLNKEAKIPKGDKSYFHRQWDLARIDNNPQAFLRTIKEALRETAVEGMEQKRVALESRIQKKRDEIAKRKTEPEWSEAKPRPRSQRLAEKEAKSKEVKNASDNLKASRQSYDKAVRDPKSTNKLREAARTKMHKAQQRFVKAQRSNPVSAEQKILELEDDLAAMRTEHARYQEKQLDEDLAIAATEVKNSIQGGTLKAGYRLKSFTSGPLKDRSFIPPSNKVDEYLMNNAGNVWNDYIDDVVPSMLMKERFGSVDLKDEIETIAREYDGLSAKAKTEKASIKIEKEKIQTLKDLNAMIDSLHGRFKVPDDPNAFLTKAARSLRAFNFVTLLGQMTVSAIPDVGSIILRHGLKGFTKGLFDVASMSKGMKLSMRQQRVFGMAIDLTNNIRAERQGMLDNNYALTSRFDRGVQKTTNLFSKLTGMNHWNAGLKQFTGFVYSNDLISDAFKLSKGTLDSKKVTQYARGGLNKSDMQSIAKAIDEQETKQMDGVFIPNPEEWADQALAQRFKSAISKEVESTIITPSMGDLPLMSRGELGRLTFQFKSFAMTANNKIILATLDDFSAQKMIGILSMVMLGGVSQIVRDTTKGKTTDLDSEEGWKKFIDNAIDRSGALGYYSDVNGLIQKATRGKAGIIPRLSDQVLDRYQSRNMLGSILGPSAGRVSDIGQITGAISSGDWRETDSRAMRRMTAFNNLFWTHRAFNKIEEGMGGKSYGPLGQEK